MADFGVSQTFALPHFANLNIHLSSWIAHRLSTIQLAHKNIIVNGGEIEEFGSHDELMAENGFYYNLYMSQFKGKGPAGEVDTSAFVST